LDKPFKTVFGLFHGNIIFCDTGEEISCVTYGIIRKEIDDKYGFYNLKKNMHGDWVIFQYVLVD
jgi:hypothetical protein